MKYLYRFKQLILLSGDFIGFVLALMISASMRRGSIPDLTKTQELLMGFFLLLLIWLVVNYIVGLYDLRLIHTKKVYRRLIEAAVTSFIIGIVFFYLNPDKQIAPKTLLLLTAGIGYLILYIWRIIYPKIIGEHRFQERIILLGDEPEMDELVRMVQTQKSLGYEIMAIYTEQRGEYDARDSIPRVHTIEELSACVVSHHINTLVVAQHISTTDDIEHFLYTCLFEQIHVTDFTAFYEHVTGRVPPSAFSKSWFLKHVQTADKPMYKKVRRLMDIVAAVMFGIILLAVGIFITAFIKLTSPGNVLFTQKRIGEGGKQFLIYKFRTMYSLAADGSAEMHGAQFASRGDKRVTSVGKFLRKTRLDELPQLINLFCGDITLIGPRPERPEIVKQLLEKMPYYSLRHAITPGLTGWAQIHQHYTDNLETSLQKLQYDLFYIKNRSLLLDLSIILKTVNVVLRGLGQ